jgi:hypothetical protein
MNPARPRSPRPTSDAEGPLAFGPRPGDWPEDLDHENGNYECVCCHCGGHFAGYKRRVTCKKCAAETDASLVRDLREEGR